MELINSNRSDISLDANVLASRFFCYYVQGPYLNFGPTVYALTGVCGIDLRETESILEVSPHGASAWAETFRIDAKLCDGRKESYFMKVIAPKDSRAGTNPLVNNCSSN